MTVVPSAHCSAARRSVTAAAAVLPQTPPLPPQALEFAARDRQPAEPQGHGEAHRHGVVAKRSFGVPTHAQL